MRTFGEKLKEARQAAGMTQAELAEQSGIPLGTIREYEQSKREPLLSKAGKLAGALKLSMESLLPDAPAPKGKRSAGQADASPGVARGAEGKVKKRRGKGT